MKTLLRIACLKEHLNSMKHKKIANLLYNISLLAKNLICF